jgi:hypothetical protein
LFLLGFWQKRGAERGFLMVNLWRIAGETWCVDGHFSGSKKLHFVRIYFCGIPILGIPLLSARLIRS